MLIDGGCHCGKITYEAEIQPDQVLICHCTDCQTLSGSAFRTVAMTVLDGFSLRTGELKIYLKTAESGRPRQQAFCGDCGSPIYSTDPGDAPKIYAVRLGTANQRDQLAPKGQIWSRSALNWMPEFGGMPAKPTT